MPIRAICGITLISDRVDILARFYDEALGLRLEREEHGGMGTFWSTEIGDMQLTIQPPENFDAPKGRSGTTVAIAFDVTSIDAYQEKVEDAGGALVGAIHDESYGRVATFRDPDGNLFELVELDYEYNP